MWRLAWRNLWRNRARTLITGSAIALMLMLRLVSVGLNEAQYASMIDSAEKGVGGAVLVNGEGYWESRTSEFALDAATARTEALRGVKGVKAVLPRIMIPGLLTSSTGNIGASVRGIVPALEKNVQDWSRYLDTGTYLEGTDQNEIVLGAALVDELNVELGDRIVVAATDREGKATQGLFYLGGILATGSKMADSGLAFVTVAGAQEMLGLEDAVTQLGVVLDEGVDRHALKPVLAAAVESQKIRAAGGVGAAAATPAETLTWDEADPQMLQLVEMDRGLNDGMGWVILFIVGFGIVNTFLMMLLERVREMGLLSALGMTPGRIARLVMAEGVLLGALFVGVGLALGAAAHYQLATTGIDIADVMGDTQVGGVLMQDMVLRSKFDAWSWFANAGVIFVLVVASAVYPAIKATKLQPATAMRTYE